jgi:hypothetical protein
MTQDESNTQDDAERLRRCFEQFLSTQPVRSRIPFASLVTELDECFLLNQSLLPPVVAKPRAICDSPLDEKRDP